MGVHEMYGFMTTSVALLEKKVEGDGVCTLYDEEGNLVESKLIFHSFVKRE